MLPAEVAQTGVDLHVVLAGDNACAWQGWGRGGTQSAGMRMPSLHRVAVLPGGGAMLVLGACVSPRQSGFTRSVRQTHLRHSLLECLEREALSLAGALSHVLIGVGHSESDCC